MGAATDGLHEHHWPKSMKTNFRLLSESQVMCHVVSEKDLTVSQPNFFIDLTSVLVLCHEIGPVVCLIFTEETSVCNVYFAR